MEKTFENDNFGTNRNNARSIPPLVVSRAKSAGTVGETWLANLDGTISELEHIWNISVGEALSGGTHAFVAYADGQNGEQYVLKIDMPESLGGEFQRSISLGFNRISSRFMQHLPHIVQLNLNSSSRSIFSLSKLSYICFNLLSICCSSSYIGFSVFIFDTDHLFSITEVYMDTYIYDAPDNGCSDPESQHAEPGALFPHTHLIVCHSLSKCRKHNRPP